MENGSGVRLNKPHPTAEGVPQVQVAVVAPVGYALSGETRQLVD